VLVPKVAEEYSFHTYLAHLTQMIKKGNLWTFTLDSYSKKTAGF
jgi:hypothetical protein